MTTITLYKLPFGYDDNFKIDNFASFLAGYDNNPVVVNNYNYVKHDDEIEIVLNRGQANYLTNQFNYASIKNGTETILYYFITSVEWASENAIRYYLKMDVLNSFGTDFVKWRDSTKIIREHKDRFKFIPGTDTRTLTSSNYDSVEQINTDYFYTYNLTFNTNLYVSFDDYEIISGNIMGYTVDKISSTQVKVVIQYGFPVPPGSFSVRFIFNVKYLVANIDRVNEGITPNLYKINSEQITARNKWYVVYKNINAINETDFNQVNPVECCLYPALPIVAKYGEYDFTFDTSSVAQSTDYYNFSPLNNNDNEIWCVINGNILKLTFNDETYRFISIRNDGTALYYQYNVGNRYTGNYQNISTGNVAEIYFMWKDKTKSDGFNYYQASAVALSSQITGTFTGSIVYQNITLHTFDELDLTDSKLIKVIASPYPPMEYTRDSNDYYTFNYEIFKIDNGVLKLRDSKSEMQNEVRTAITLVPYSELRENNYLYNYRNNQVLRTGYDTKLLSSDFHFKKFVYDSFNYIFKNEMKNLTNYDDENFSQFRFNFKITNTINSRFLFDFAYNIGSQLSQEDFDTILIASRNNEMTIYSNQYINYLRNGYNYDVKAKERRNVGAIIGGIGGAIVGASQIATGNALGGGITLVNSLMGTINSIGSNEESIEQRKNQLQNQATSVSGSDDVDLLEYYADNRAFMNLYEPSDEMKDALNNLFFFTGYASQRIGKPKGQTRRYFDFLQCDADIYIYNVVGEWVLNNLKNKYKEGVTIFHPYNSYYDLKRERENYETGVFTNEV